MKRILSAALVLILTLAVSFGASARTDNNAKLGVGMDVTGFSSVDVVTGETITSDILDGVVMTVINEWADWCGPCMSEMPHFQAMHEYYSATPEDDVQILGSVYCSPGGTTPESAAEFLTSNGYTWHNIVEDTVLAQVFNTSSYIPQTIIVDRYGVVRDHAVGGFSEEELREFIEGWYETLLDEELGEPEIPLGDANGDGNVDAIDALLVLRFSMGIIQELPFEFAADANNDGNVDTIDALLILRAAMGLVTL